MKLQETTLLDTCCELLRKEKSAAFQGKVAQDMRNYCVLVAMPVNIPKTCFSDYAPYEGAACHMNFRLRHHSGHHAYAQEKKRPRQTDPGMPDSDLLCQQ